MVRAHIDDVLTITKNNFEDHLKELDKALQRLVEAGLKVNTEKLFLVRTETEYIGFWVSNNRVRPLSSKVEAIKSIDVKIKVSEVRRFVVLVKYYRDMWHKRAHTLALLKNIFNKSSVQMDGRGK